MWLDAKKGEGRARYIIAHEIGHIYLHDYMPSSFSSTNFRHFKSLPEEQTAEWQAHTFAKYFILPDSIVLNFIDAPSIMFRCNIDDEIAIERLQKVNRKYKRPPLYAPTPQPHEGDSCPNCSNFTLIRTGLLVRCDVCGAKATL
ncbi:ImmA/IrrE family metallo-endopeptidase [Labrys monachus]|uniref:ImmA/IrrE family metallo-endopeptidase n=1 Tax=Labrys monachus TaxID=217067 RepID=UPI00351FC8D8